MNILRLLLIALFLLPCAPQALADEPVQVAVATAHPLATEAGLAILDQGGNAFDAAVAVSAALAVVEPYSSGIGGGGFWLLHQASSGRDIMVDGRETAPAAAHRDMYLDETGEVIPNASMNGPLAAGIPGEPAALVHIAEKYGRLPLIKSLAPAIYFAREGFEVTPHYRNMAEWRLEALRASPAAAHLFLHNDEVPPIGHRIRQPDLARTLELLGVRGFDGFYKGETANKLLDGVKANGGIWRAEDLANYRIIEREPVRGHYRGYEIISAAPPSSGGIALITMLNILANYNLEALDEADRTHLLIESMRRAYRDRAEFLGDPDVVNIPVERLLHPYYADGLAATIRLDRATPSADLPGYTKHEGGNDTTHFSILDSEGNYVAATLSINYPFGSGFVAEGTGVLLNDEMDDFAAKPGVPNAYGLVGAEANAIAPGKRMLSSMTPTFVRNDERIAILGTPGGSRIITMVLLGTLEAAEGKEPEAWVGKPRIHHQYLPDLVSYEEEALSLETVDELLLRGHQLKRSERPWGNMQAVLWDVKNEQVSAASDPRVEGAAMVK